MPLTIDDVRANILRIRKKKLTGEIVARRMGISRPFYVQLEGGTRRLSVDYLLGIAEALCVKPQEFLK